MVNERNERRILYSRFFDAILLARQEQNEQQDVPVVSRDSSGNFVNFNLYPCPFGPVHPFKCHANGATNAPRRKTNRFLRLTLDTHVKISIGSTVERYFNVSFEIVQPSFGRQTIG